MACFFHIHMTSSPLLYCTPSQNILLVFSSVLGKRAHLLLVRFQEFHYCIQKVLPPTTYTIGFFQQQQITDIPGALRKNNKTRLESVIWNVLLGRTKQGCAISNYLLLIIINIVSADAAQYQLHETLSAIRPPRLCTRYLIFMLPLAVLPPAHPSILYHD